MGEAALRKMLEVLLIYPGSSFGYDITLPIKIPLGIAYIAAVLRKNDIDVNVMDLRFYSNWGDVKKQLMRYSLDIVGISSETVNINRAFKMAELSKVVGAKVVIGGAHATVLPEQTVSHGNVDIVVIGEGERTFLELVKTFEKASDLGLVEGILYKNKEGIIERNPPRKPIEDLDDLPFPARELFPMDKIINQPGSSFPLPPLSCLSMLASRGCIFNCSFCQPTLRKLFGRKVRRRSAQNVVEEIEHMKKRWGIKSIYFVDDTFTLNHTWLNSFCELMRERDLKIMWECQSRVDTVNEDILKKMRECGCRRISYGVESGSQRILDEVFNKGVKIDDIINAVTISKRLGIVTGVSVMIGSPSETLEDLEKTRRLLKKLNPHTIGVNITTPMPGTALYDKAKERGLIIATDFSKLFRQNYGKLKLNVRDKDLRKYKTDLQRSRFSIRHIHDDYYMKLALERARILFRRRKLGSIFFDLIDVQRMSHRFPDSLRKFVRNTFLNRI